MTFQEDVSKRLDSHAQELRNFERDRLQKEIEQFEKENPESIF